MAICQPAAPPIAPPTMPLATWTLSMFSSRRALVWPPRTLDCGGVVVIVVVEAVVVAAAVAAVVVVVVVVVEVVVAAVILVVVVVAVVVVVSVAVVGVAVVAVVIVVVGVAKRRRTMPSVPTCQPCPLRVGAQPNPNSSSCGGVSAIPPRTGGHAAPSRCGPTCAKMRSARPTHGPLT